MPFTYGRKSINDPMNNWLQANDHQLPLQIPKFKKSVIGGMMGVYMKNLGCSPISAVMSLEYIMVQMHLNTCDYSLKFHLSKLPKLSYTAANSFTLNLRIFS